MGSTRWKAAAAAFRRAAPTREPVLLLSAVVFYWGAKLALMWSYGTGPFLGAPLPRRILPIALFLVFLLNGAAFQALLARGRRVLRAVAAGFLCLAPYAPDFHAALAAFEASSPAAWTAFAWIIQGTLATLVLLAVAVPLWRALSVAPGARMRFCAPFLAGNIMAPLVGAALSSCGWLWMWPAGFTSPLVGFAQAAAAVPGGCPAWIVIDPRADDDARRAYSEDEELFKVRVLLPALRYARAATASCGVDAGPVRLLFPETALLLDDAAWPQLGRALVELWDLSAPGNPVRGVELWIGVGDGSRSRSLLYSYVPGDAEAMLAPFPPKRGLVPIFEDGRLHELPPASPPLGEGAFIGLAREDVPQESSRPRPRTCYELLDLNEWWKRRGEVLVVGQSNHSSFRRIGIISGAFDLAVLQIAWVFKQPLLLASNAGSSGLFLPPAKDSVIGVGRPFAAVVKIFHPFEVGGSP